jgi:hypothetical protein
MNEKHCSTCKNSDTTSSKCLNNINPRECLGSGINFIYKLWEPKENKMEKEYCFDRHETTLKELAEKGACDEGILWYTKNITLKGINCPQLEYLYQEVPRDSWRDWLRSKFPNYITELKSKYCCEDFGNLVNGKQGGGYDYSCAEGLVKKCHDSYYVYCAPNRNERSWNFGITYCPFCGKKL